MRGVSGHLRIRVGHGGSIRHTRGHSGRIRARRRALSVTTSGKHENRGQHQDRLHRRSIRGQLRVNYTV